MTITWASARAWRLQRHFLSGERGADVEEVIGRLTTVPAWSGDPELAVAMRLASPSPHAVATALADGALIRTFTFGGATHLMRPEDARDLLAIRSAGRQWELKSWQDYYRLAPDDWPDLRAAVRDAVADGPLTRAELSAAVTVIPRFAHLGPAFVDDSFTFLKPFAWQGDLALGPSRDGEVTLMSLHPHPGWGGIADLDEAGHRAIVGYLGAYGPAAIDRLHHWFGQGLSAGRRRIDRWVRELDDRLTDVEIEGDTAVALGEHLAAIERAEASDEVHFLGGHDQWVFGPGTTETRIVPPSLRPLATRGARLVLVGGLVCGSWRMGKRALEVTLTGGAPIAHSSVDASAARVAALMGQPDVDIVVN